MQALYMNAAPEQEPCDFRTECFNSVGLPITDWSQVVRVSMMTSQQYKPLVCRAIYIESWRSDWLTHTRTVLVKLEKGLAVQMNEEQDTSYCVYLF